MLRADETGGKKRVPVYPTMDQSLRAGGDFEPEGPARSARDGVHGRDGGPMAVTLLDFLKGLPA